MADLILDGSYNAHIRRMRVEYKCRRDALREAISKHAQADLLIHPCCAGQHLVAEFSDENWPEDTVIANKL